MPELLHKYQNGNCEVTILDDGTKTRTWEGIASPIYPESIDIKITDYCDAACAYCHEKSTKNGRHGQTSDILRIISGLPPGVELAVGGGNPLSHPDFVCLLKEMKSLGLVVNVTINAIHVEDYSIWIDNLRKEKLIRGLGISYHPKHVKTINHMQDDNTVVHVIAGVHNPQDIRKLLEFPKYQKILVLGYKQFGFGLKFYKPEVERCLAAWRYWIAAFLQNKNASISFDNLGLEQLRVKDLVPKEIWGARYMGDDGTFTMYIDTVKNEYAPTSTGKRSPIGTKTISEIFADVRLGKV